MANIEYPHSDHQRDMLRYGALARHQDVQIVNTRWSARKLTLYLGCSSIDCERISRAAHASNVCERVGTI